MQPSGQSRLGGLPCKLHEEKWSCAQNRTSTSKADIITTTGVILEDHTQLGGAPLVGNANYFREWDPPATDMDLGTAPQRPQLRLIQ